ncbi:hypothetical protein WJX81_004790 [Elliptochloris bilobata]|uniref:Uncharacterized protein n=1 Tax=Elliptochloris bilobata TaxID=381761 RepID=A0AAW1SJ89_9CHLO
MAKRFDGKVAVVTGAAQGIGKAIALRLVSEGAQVVFADIDGEAAGAAKPVNSSWLSVQPALSSFKVDMAQEAEVEALIRHTVSTHGQIDVFVNNAARYIFAETISVTEEELATNVKGYVFGVKHAARAMQRNPGDARKLTAGAIVNIASTSGLLAQPGFVPYSMGKAAVMQLSRCAALDLGKHGIRVNTVAPGPILTDGTRRHAESSGQALEVLCEEMTCKQIIQRMGTVDEVAAAVAFLASGDASYITGSCLTVDGGLTAL